MNIRPRGLMLYQGVPAVVLGSMLLIVDLVVFERPFAVGVALGIACLVLAALSCMPLLRLDSRGVYVRNVLRRGRWPSGEHIRVQLGETQMLLTRGMIFSRLVIDDGVRRVPVAATTGLARARVEELLASLNQCGAQVHPEVESRHFPRPDRDLSEMFAEAAREWQEEQEIYRRLEEYRKRKP